MCSDLKSWPVFGSLEPEFVSRIHMVLTCGDLSNEALIVMKDEKVYALENNAARNAHKTFCLTEVEILCGKDVKTLVYMNGYECVLALAENGEVYVWGLKNHLKYHNSTSTKNISLKDTVIMEHVVDIACGSTYSVFVTEKGEVFTWGALYDRNHSPYDTQPDHVITFGIMQKKFVQVACGLTFNILLTDQGEVYGWGKNDSGQLGTGNYGITYDDDSDYGSVYTPCELKLLLGIVIVKVACGRAHALALTDDGKLYSWGENDYGQLGLDNKTKTCNPTMVVHNMGRVSDIAAVYTSDISAAVGENECIYVWGSCGDKSILVPTPTQFSIMHDVFAFYSLSNVMHKPLIINTEEQINALARVSEKQEKTDLLQCLENAFNDESTSDLTIRVESQVIYVHKAILKIRSSYFRTMFQHNWSENITSVIEHTEYSYAVLKAFLKYLYTGTIDLPPENAVELFKLADAYCEDKLKRHCIRLIKQDINVENVVFLYITAIQYDAEDLKEICFKFALSHMTEVTLTSTFDKLDENMLKMFIKKAAKAGAFKT